eukprot:CAMPEP_0118953036 /NCGR_PEP_ID=MMETSP1169-20130426/55837_1 /TAXON_ID=36882 /ORGANISM="Pyramimonas obovata, Strain CCMP722" /LENGTH=54 /DNA_ID=CAMNT_0006900395 /DNA_START=214 /DNA_END=375 /DNA_ORIENTATION=-
MSGEPTALPADVTCEWCSAHGAMRGRVTRRAPCATWARGGSDGGLLWRGYGAST